MKFILQETGQWIYRELSEDIDLVNYLPCKTCKHLFHEHVFYLNEDATVIRAVRCYKNECTCKQFIADVEENKEII